MKLFFLIANRKDGESKVCVVVKHWDIKKKKSVKWNQSVGGSGNNSRIYLLTFVLQSYSADNACSLGCLVRFL